MQGLSAHELSSASSKHSDQAMSNTNEVVAELRKVEAKYERVLKENNVLKANGGGEDGGHSRGSSGSSDSSDSWKTLQKTQMELEKSEKDRRSAVMMKVEGEWQ